MQSLSGTKGNGIGAELETVGESAGKSSTATETLRKAIFGLGGATGAIAAISVHLKHPEIVETELRAPERGIASLGRQQELTTHEMRNEVQIITAGIGFKFMSQFSTAEEIPNNLTCQWATA